MIARYVTDASVMLKWVLGDQKELDQVKAMQILNLWAAGDATILAPALWQFEVGNFLGRVMPEEAMDKMSLLMSLKVQNVELSETMYQLCFAWMNRYGVSFYDGSYLAVAHELHATLVTADEKFVKKMGNTDHLCLLKDFDL